MLLPPLVPMASRHGDGLLWGCRSVARVVVPGTGSLLPSVFQVAEWQKNPQRGRSTGGKGAFKHSSVVAKETFIHGPVHRKETFIHDPVHGEGDLHTRACSREGDFYTGP